MLSFWIYKNEWLNICYTKALCSLPCIVLTGIGSHTELPDVLCAVVPVAYIICMPISKLFKVEFWDPKQLTSSPFLTFPSNLLFLWVKWWVAAVVVAQGHYSVVCAVRWEHFATFPYDLSFILCFIFIPLLITLNETAPSRDDSRACFSLWVYYLCFGFLQAA